MEKDIKPLFFSTAKILKASGSNLYKAKSIFIDHFRRPNPKYDGNSFILNPTAVCEIVGNDLEVLDYILLLGQRNYFDYKYLGRRGLSVDLCTVPVEKLKTNRLLKIDESYIKFIYEENYGN